MKKIEDIQNVIKNKEKLCIFIDYNNLLENLEYAYTNDAREGRDLRVIQNFLNCSFIKTFVMYKKNISQKDINKLGTKFPEITFFKYEKNKFNEICSSLKNDSTFLYIGNNEDIINMDKFLNDYTIMISSAMKKTCKTVDFQLSIQELVDILLETNNLYL